MPSYPTDVDPKSWGRFFAIECNNRAWHLAGRHRGAEENAEMLNAAHASAWHWGMVGTELQHMRATMLLARVHALLGYGDSALAYAETMRTFFLNRETPDWELAFVHAVYAHAAYAVGDQDAHRAAYDLALAAFEKIGSEEERKIFRETLELVPNPRG